MHDDWPVGLYVPAEQLVHTAAPISLKEPAPQVVHEDWPKEAALVPPLQRTQVNGLVAPIALLKVPGEHELQEEEDSEL